jgi:predicted ribonuclease YlaK
MGPAPRAARRGTGNCRIFLARPGRIVVLDTSALMEGVLFTGYDWHALDAGLAAEAVRLIVPILVIEELNGLKRTRDRQQKADAREVLRAMWALHSTTPTVPAALPQAANVTIEIYLDGDWHKRRDNNDGEIIDQALKCQSSVHPSGTPVSAPILSDHLAVSKMTAWRRPSRLRILGRR